MLQEVKEYLKITMNIEDDKLEGFIKRGKSHLQGLTGTELDFSKEDLPKSLLMDYCRYAYNNGLEYFEENFSKEILRLQLIEGVKSIER